MSLALAFWVAAGSALGGVTRSGLTHAIQSRLLTPFPAATLSINVIGSLILGFVMRIALNSTALSVETQLFLTAGFCGGFTTFSTFSYETLRLLEDGDYRRAGLYVLASVALSLIGVLVGFSLARALLAARRGI